MSLTIIERWLDHGASSNIPTRVVVHSMGHYILHEGVYKAAASFLDDVGLSAHALYGWMRP